MNKRARYWTIGIIAAAAVILAVWAVAAQTARSRRDTGEARTDHAGMDHGVSDAGGDAGPLGGYLRDQDKIMADMMTDMETIDKSGSASVDFLYGMIPHHRSAVEMAESYLKHGGREERLVKIANDIIETQTKEIDQMNTMIAELEKAGRRDEEKEAAYLAEYDKMFADHHTGHGSAPAGIDAAFSEGMIGHHQMAVDMAEAVLGYSDDAQVQQLAQTMIDAQKAEIGQMRAILDELQ